MAARRPCWGLPNWRSERVKSLGLLSLVWQFQTEHRIKNNVFIEVYKPLMSHSRSTILLYWADDMKTIPQRTHTGAGGREVCVLGFSNSPQGTGQGASLQTDTRLCGRRTIWKLYRSGPVDGMTGRGNGPTPLPQYSVLPLIWLYGSIGSWPVEEGLLRARSKKPRYSVYAPPRAVWTRPKVHTCCQLSLS